MHGAYIKIESIGVLTIYNILLIYIYICCAFVGLENKLYKTHGTYIKIGRKKV